MYYIRKKFSFDAAHYLNHMPEGHKCARPHGHTYHVEIVLGSSALQLPQQWVRDYGDLTEFKVWLDQTCDHRDLNEVFEGTQTTAEMLARRFFMWCHSRWPEVCAVLVSETENTWAEYTNVL